MNLKAPIRRNRSCHLEKMSICRGLLTPRHRKCIKDGTVNTEKVREARVWCEMRESEARNKLYHCFFWGVLEPGDDSAAGFHRTKSPTRHHYRVHFTQIHFHICIIHFGAAVRANCLLFGESITRSSRGAQTFLTEDLLFDQPTSHDRPG